MKHAYLIMAHNEFEHLQRLIDALDDERNDIYVHFDRKVKRLPILHSCKSNLHIIETRINVCWGHVSQIEAEMILFETAYKHENYSFYHLISGAHYPLKSQDEIHSFFDRSKMSVLTPLPVNEKEIATKLGKYHFFLRGMKVNNQTIAKSSRLLWRICSRIQRLFKQRDFSYFYEKCSQWVSLTSNDTQIIISNRQKYLRKLRYTFCCDEIAIPSILHEAKINYQKCNHILFTAFECASPKTLTSSDFDKLMESDCFFARKFTNQSTDLVNKIQTHISSYGNK